MVVVGNGGVLVNQSTFTISGTSVVRENFEGENECGNIVGDEGNIEVGVLSDGAEAYITGEYEANEMIASVEGSDPNPNLADYLFNDEPDGDIYCVEVSGEDIVRGDFCAFTITHGEVVKRKDTLTKAFSLINESGDYTITLNSNADVRIGAVLNKNAANVTLKSAGAVPYTLTRGADCEDNLITVSAGNLTLEDIKRDVNSSSKPC